MTIKLTEKQRIQLETLLDNMALALGVEEGFMSHKLRRDYQRGVSLVREVPQGHRRLRSDFNDKGNKRQQPLPEIETIQ